METTKDVNHIEKILKDSQKKIDVPSKEDVRSWTKRDCSAASYFLAMLLRYPEILEKIADEMYERIMWEEQGAFIDKIVNKGKEDKNGIHN